MKSGQPLVRRKTRRISESRPGVWQGLAFALLVLAALEMGGCGMGTTELPATTQPGGPGFLSITTPQLSDSVQGLPYTATINTTGGSNTLAACTVISGALPPGFAPPVPQGSTCILTTNGQPVGAAGRYSFTLQAGDTSTPQHTDNHVYNLTVRPEFTINPPAILDGIAGRSYTRAFTVSTNLQNHAAGQVIAGSSEAGNGPATSCSISGLPGTVSASCSIDASQVNTSITMQAGSGSLAAGTYPFSISVTDSPIGASNQALPAVPPGTVTLALNLVVRPEFTITQAALIDGVQGRTYGVSPLAQPAATDLSATVLSESGEPTEAGNGPVTACTLSVASANPGLSVAPNQNNCMLESVSPVAIAPTYGAQTYSVTVSATDNPIKDPASGQIVVPANTIIKTLAWTAQAPISYSINFDTAAGQPGQVPDAVQNRTYGAPAKSALEATAVGGLSNETGAAIVESGALPPGLTCANGAPNPAPVLICGSGGALVTSAPGTVSFAVTASDPGNTATPPGSSSTDLRQHASHAINVDKPLALATNFTTPLPQAVANQSYGAAPLTPLQYTASGGLGGYLFTTVTGQAAPGNGFPAGIACNQGSGAAANAFSCATPTGAVITGGASATTPYTPTVTLDDTANGTTPDGAASNTGFSQTSSLMVNPPLSITAAGSAAPAPPPGVVGRTYGVGSGFQALVYSISGGVQPYTITAVSATGAPAADSVPAPMACSGLPAAPAPPTQLVCESSTGIAANPGTYPFTVSVHDAGTASDPVSTVLLNQSMAVNAAMTLTPASTSPPLAVLGRTYGSGSACGASGTSSCAPIVYNISGGLGGYSATPTISGFPGTFTCPLSASGLSGTYSCSTTGAVAGASPATLSLTASDTANSATPARTLPSNNVSLSIAQPLTLTLTSGAPPPAVFGRAYASGAGCSGGACAPVVYTIANGTGVYPASATLTTSAGPFTCALAGSAYDCASTSITLNPGASPATESLNVSVNDVANASTPSAPVSNSAATLTVNPALNIAGPSGTLAIAVVGRSFGAGSTCGASGTSACATIGYTITGGLGGYSSTPTRNLYPTTFACPFASTGALSGTYTCSSTGGVTGSGSPSVSITAADTANTSTPTASATSNTATLPISPALSITPPATVNPAVQGRVYGQGAGCSGGACAPVPYVISGGTTVYSTGSLTSAAGTFVCTLSSTTYNCASANITGSPGGNTLSFTASDVADASTPAKSVSLTTPAILTINPAMTIARASGQSTTANTGVVGRAYGSGSGCSGGTCVPIQYTVAGGLGNYASTASFTPPASITGFSCSLSGTTYSCSSASLGPTSLSTPATAALSITTSETGNASTPGATTLPDTSVSLTVNPAMSIAPATGQGTPATAVVGRAYGSGSGCSGGTCAPVKYTVTGGLGNYASTASLSETPTAVTGLACPLSGTTYSCSATSLGPASLSSAATDTLNMNTTETGNASTPGATTPTDTSLTLDVNPVLALNITTPSPLTSGIAVTSRSYGKGTGCSGSGGNCAPLEYTATGGTIQGTAGNYTYPGTIPSALSAAGFNSCSTSGTNAANYSCTSPSISTLGPGTIDLSGVTVDDSANASTPAFAPLSLSGSLTVDAAISIQQTAVTNDLLDYPYLNSTGGQQITALNGLGAYTWVPPGGTPAGACAAAPTGTVPTGLTFPAATPITGTTIALTGTPTSASAADTDFTFGLCLTDTGNQTTPAGSALSNPPTNSYTLNVFNRYAFIVDNNASATIVRLINTGENAIAPSNPALSTTTQVNMQGAVAVTPNGKYAFVPLTSTNGFAVFDTITHSAVSGSPFSFPPGATCTGPVGVAFSPDSSTAYFACGGNSAVVSVKISNLSSLSAVHSASTGTAVPASIALTQDGATLCVITSGTSQLLTYTASTLASAAVLSLAPSETPVALALAVNSTNVYAYIAETKSGTPGQVEVFNVTSQTAVPGSPIVFLAISSTNPEPSCIAATPDNKRVYVGLQATDTFAVIDNTGATPAVISGSPFLLPSAVSQSGTTLGTSSPNGITIPPLSTLPGTGYRVFFTSVNSGNGEVDVINNNIGPSPPSSNTTLLPNFGSSSTPQGIAAIPVPQ